MVWGSRPGSASPSCSAFAAGRIRQRPTAWAAELGDRRPGPLVADVGELVALGGECGGLAKSATLGAS